MGQHRIAIFVGPGWPPERRFRDWPDADRGNRLVCISRDIAEEDLALTLPALNTPAPPLTAEERRRLGALIESHADVFGAVGDVGFDAAENLLHLWLTEVPLRIRQDDGRFYDVRPPKMAIVTPTLVAIGISNRQ